MRLPARDDGERHRDDRGPEVCGQCRRVHSQPERPASLPYPCRAVEQRIRSDTASGAHEQRLALATTHALRATSLGLCQPAAVHAVVQLGAVVIGVALIVWGAETFAEHLAGASHRLGVSAFALAILLAGAEPEELATAVTASLRHAPGIALGDVIGANIAICLVALGVGAWIAPLPFGRSVLWYAALGLPIGGISAWLAWDGNVSRPEGLLLVVMYAVYVALIWIVERRPPALGETAELDTTKDTDEVRRRRVGRELALVVLGVAAMAGGAILLVDGVRNLSHVESTQTRLGLTVVGFATAFELVVLAWSSARRGVSEAVVAGVVGSYAYNATMTLGAGALARPLHVVNAHQLHAPWIVMLAALALVLALAVPGRSLKRPAGIVLLVAYVLAVVLILAR
jgi:cation:H+ antiporter